MKVVALISGGKDSCYNMIQCVAEGHDLVALANLHPQQTDELDSYMFQTVGHHVIQLYAEAIGLPLYRRTIQGGSLEQGRDYQPTDGDEVEDLYQLLLTVKTEMGIEAVSVGAILSNYQRVRVENVCSRLGLTPLAYLWRRDQEELLQEMIDAQIQAIIIKVAALGLTSKHLGLTLKEIQPHMLKMKEKYQLNVCGEGGEFETLTLDCPLFNKKIVIDSSESVVHSDDAFAPVHYLHFKKMHLEDKAINTSLSFSERISSLPIKRGNLLLQELGIFDSTTTVDEDVNNPEESPKPVLNSASNKIDAHKTFSHHNSRGYLHISGIIAICDSTTASSIKDATKLAMDRLAGELQEHGHTLSDVTLVHLYVSDMSNFASINSVYCQYFALNPPARVCVQLNLPSNVAAQLDCLSHHGDQSNQEEIARHTMHVQGISHWAPANIGPYSQSVQLSNTLFCAGTIGLCPSSMQMIEGGITPQCKLSLRSVSRVLEAMHHGLNLSDVLVNVCYVSHSKYIATAREHWQKAGQESLLVGEGVSPGDVPKAPSIFCTVVVPMLPKGALVEWHVVASTNKQSWHFEEKVRISKHDYLISLQVLSSQMEGCCAVMASVDWSSDEGWAWLLEAMARHVCDCIGGELRHTTLTWKDAMSLRVFYQQEADAQSSILEAFQSSFKDKGVSCPAIVAIPVELLSGKSVMSVILWLQGEREVGDKS